MVLEGGKPGDGFPAKLERRHAIRDALFGIRDNRHDGLAQLRKRAPLGLVERGEILVDLVPDHGGIFDGRTDEGQGPLVDGRLLRRATVSTSTLALVRAVSNTGSWLGREDSNSRP